MKRIFIIASLVLLGATVSAQEAEKKEAPKGYQFTTVDSLGITPVKDQANSGTCWSFSSIGFFESELLRLGKGEHDLAEMFVVHKTMEDRAKATETLNLHREAVSMMWFTAGETTVWFPRRLCPASCTRVTALTTLN